MRKAYWDNLRFLLICLVVISHGYMPHNIVGGVTSGIIVFINTFHMPLFIFVSGLFHNNKDIFRRIVLLLTYTLYFKTLNMEWGHLVFGSGKAITLFRESTAPWFLIALAAFALITYLVRDIKPTFVLSIAVSMGCLALYDSMITGSEVLSRVVGWFPYYYIGTVVDKDKLFEFIKNKKVKMAGFVIVAVWAFVCFYFRRGIWNMQYLAVPTAEYAKFPYYCNGLIKLLHYIMVCLIGIGIMTMVPGRKLIGISKWGRNTLSVYIYHLFIRSIFEKYGWGAWLCSSNVMIILYAFINIVITIILSQDICQIPTDIIKKHCFAISTERRKDNE